jgi:hypothetical protein
VKAADVPLVDQQITYRTLQTLINTPTIPDRYKPPKSDTGVDDMLAAVMIGKEIGIGPMQAINELYLVNGTVSMTGKLMSALVHRRGHAITVNVTGTKATATGYRRDPYTHKLVEVGDVTFSEADAKTAGLWGKGTYEKYPRIMLSWRAISMLCRVYFADCLAGVSYVPDEMGVVIDVEALPEDIDLVIEGEAIGEQATAIVKEELDAEVVVEIPPKAKPKKKPPAKKPAAKKPEKK